MDQMVNIIHADNSNISLNAKHWRLQTYVLQGEESKFMPYQLFNLLLQAINNLKDNVIELATFV